MPQSDVVDFSRYDDADLARMWWAAVNTRNYAIADEISFELHDRGLQKASERYGDHQSAVIYRPKPIPFPTGELPNPDAHRRAVELRHAVGEGFRSFVVGMMVLYVLWLIVSVVAFGGVR